MEDVEQSDIDLIINIVSQYMKNNNDIDVQMVDSAIDDFLTQKNS